MNKYFLPTILISALCSTAHASSSTESLGNSYDWGMSRSGPQSPRSSPDETKPELSFQDQCRAMFDERMSAIGSHYDTFIDVPTLENLEALKRQISTAYELLAFRNNAFLKDLGYGERLDMQNLKLTSPYILSRLLDSLKVGYEDYKEAPTEIKSQTIKKLLAEIEARAQAKSTHQNVKAEVAKWRKEIYGNSIVIALLKALNTAYEDFKDDTTDQKLQMVRRCYSNLEAQVTEHTDKEVRDQLVDWKQKLIRKGFLADPSKQLPKHEQDFIKTLPEGIAEFYFKHFKATNSDPSRTDKK